MSTKSVKWWSILTSLVKRLYYRKLLETKRRQHKKPKRSKIRRRKNTKRKMLPKLGSKRRRKLRSRLKRRRIRRNTRTLMNPNHFLSETLALILLRHNSQDSWRSLGQSSLPFCARPMSSKEMLICRALSLRNHPTKEQDLSNSRQRHQLHSYSSFQRKLRNTLTKREGTLALRRTSRSLWCLL